MSRYRGPVRGALVVLVAAFAIGAAAGAFAQAAPPPVNGTIASIDGNMIKLTLADNSQKEVALNAKTLVLERSVATVADIKPGDAMGVAARRSGNDLIATNINIFSPEMWTIVGKGQWPMTTGETMTNALVTSYATQMSGHTLMMKYQDVTATITVPDGVQIHKLETVKPSTLVVGMTVSVRGMAGSDGTVKAAAISFDGPAKT